MAGPGHKCPGPDCKEHVPETQLMCRRHWGQVPRPLQRHLYDAWDNGRGGGSTEHLNAMIACIEAITP